MNDISYGMKIRAETGLEETEARVREALADEGFGVLTEIDVAATLAAKLGVDHASYRIRSWPTAPSPSSGTSACCCRAT